MHLGQTRDPACSSEGLLRRVCMGLPATRVSTGPCNVVLATGESLRDKFETLRGMPPQTNLSGLFM